MLRRFSIFILSCALAFLAGCTTPENPVTPGGESQQGNNQEPNPTNKTKEVSIKVVMSFIGSRETLFPDNVKMRHILRFYRIDDFGSTSTPDFEKVQICDSNAEITTINVELEPDNYRVLIWSDFVRNDVDWFWNPDDFSMVKFRIPYEGSSIYKLCCFGDESHDFSKDLKTASRTIRSSSCVAGFRIVATDAASFEGKDLTAVISYQDPIPSAFNLFDGSVSATSSGISLSSPVEKLEDGTVSIAYDYILMATNEASYKAKLALQEKDGTVLLEQDITIPLKKGQETLLKGELLAGGASSGITLDPSFDGDYHITF